MMATTHVFGALSLAALVAVLVPEFALVVAIAAIVGGFFPDLDLYAGHRKTLHFPVYYTVTALPATAVAVFVPTPATVGVAVFLVSAALHSVSDAFGGGLELKPWLGTSRRAVYSHYHGRWIPPRRWVRYDGAPEDLALASVLAVPALWVFDGVVLDVVVALLLVSIGYTIARKRMVTVTEWFVSRAPAAVVERIPERFLPVESESIEPYAVGD